MVSYPDLPSSLTGGRNAGSEWYFTGRPCIHGHVARRKTKTRACEECNRVNWLAASKRKRSNPDYAEKERVKNRERAAFLRATDPDYVVAKNEANRVYAQKRRDTDPEYVDRMNAWRRAIWRDNADFRERTNAYVKQWLAQNVEKKRAHGNNRRALILVADGTFSGEDIIRIQDEQGYCCKYCQADTSVLFHVDHVVPLSRGGSNWPTNLQVLCPSCNLRKRDKMPEEFLVMLAANDNFAIERQSTANE